MYSWKYFERTFLELCRSLAKLKTQNILKKYPYNVLIHISIFKSYIFIYLGGDAELELVDSLDPFSEGIVFSVRPPKKSWKNITNLSGGEKTLSSLALVFALHYYKVNLSVYLPTFQHLNIGWPPPGHLTPSP